MSLRFPSLDVLGKGAWRVSDSSPFKPEVVAQPKAQKPKREGPTPHELLYSAILTAGGLAVELEFKNAVPGRKYAIDLAFPKIKLAIEVDGWEWHGKHKGDFERDRERQNLLTINGWRILRYSAGQIRADIQACVDQIKIATGERDWSNEVPEERVSECGKWILAQQDNELYSIRKRVHGAEDLHYVIDATKEVAEHLLKVLPAASIGRWVE